MRSYRCKLCCSQHYTLITKFMIVISRNGDNIHIRDWTIGIQVTFLCSDEPSCLSWIYNDVFPLVGPMGTLRSHALGSLCHQSGYLWSLPPTECTISEPLDHLCVCLHKEVWGVRFGASARGLTWVLIKHSPTFSQRFLEQSSSWSLLVRWNFEKTSLEKITCKRSYKHAVLAYVRKCITLPRSMCSPRVILFIQLHYLNPDHCETTWWTYQKPTSHRLITWLMSHCQPAEIKAPTCI